jgi:predicted secreted protein
MRQLFWILFLGVGRLSAQSLLAGAEFTNFTWEKLNNSDAEGNGWGRGLTLQGTRPLTSVLEMGLAISAGEFNENVTTPGIWDLAPYGRLNGQFIWSPLKSIMIKETRYSVRVFGGYSLNYVPAFGSLGYKKVHTDVGLGLRQILRFGEHTGVFADVSHHQRLGADFKTMLCVRSGLLFSY